jgi:hypothetical protein
VLHQFVPERLFGVRAGGSEPWHPVDDVYSQVVPVQSFMTTMSKGVVVVPRSL